MLQCNYKEEEVKIVMLTAIVVTVSILGLAWCVGQKKQYQ
jgi:multisubunit Na+/H+ antiporter MnhC subunit